MIIAVDGSGGDLGLEATTAAAVQAARKGRQVIITGDERLIMDEFTEAIPSNISIHHAPQVIGSDDQPVAAVRRRRKSSLVEGINLLADGKADAFVSAGNTGALMVAGKLFLDTIAGVDRPALGATLPTIDGKGCFMLDLGAGTDVRAEHLVQYAIMGEAFVRLARDNRSPRVALLNVGVEQSKGTETYRRAYDQLAAADVNFIGNIEGRDLLSGTADVIVCDGFVGNIVLKFAEGLAETIFGLLKQHIQSSIKAKLGALLLKPGLKGIKDALDYRKYGGAPLLGVNGLIVKCHGSSDVQAIENGIEMAWELASRDLTGDIEARVARAFKED